MNDGAPGVRIATLNVWGTRGDWPARRRALWNGFRDLAADVVTLQETVRTDTYDQAADILGPEFRLVHQRRRESDGQGVTTASRWPVGSVIEVDLHVTPRTAGFACTSLVTEILAPPPVGRLLVVNHFPSWRPTLEHERQLQAVAAAREIERRLDRAPAHVIVAGDLDADPQADSVRFWTGRHALAGLSVCYRDAWESAHPGEPGPTFLPDNPLNEVWDWPFGRIDYILVRCDDGGQPTLAVADCGRIFDQPVAGAWASDHFGVVADLWPLPALARPGRALRP